MISWLLYTHQPEVMLMSGSNTCYYSPGEKHECCTHQHYCIFNNKRIALEKQITKLLNKRECLKNQLRNLLTNEYYTSANYNTTKKELKIIENDLRQLRLFQKRIFDKEIDGYGFR